MSYAFNRICQGIVIYRLLAKLAQVRAFIWTIKMQDSTKVPEILPTRYVGLWATWGGIARYASMLALRGVDDEI